MSRADLSGILGRESYRHAVICTFTFEPQFFEDYCLEYWHALGERTTITVVADSRTYHALTTVDPSQRPRLANVRYLLHPVSVAGVFHPKIFLFASRDKGLLIVGSSNFTRSGLGLNAELVAVYRYQRNKFTNQIGLFRQALQFLYAVARHSPSGAFFERLEELQDEADWLEDLGVPEKHSTRLLHNIEGPLWRQLTTNLPRRVREVHALSRFFDAEPSVLADVLADLNPEKIVLWTENDLTTMTPAWFELPAALHKRVQVRTVSISDGDYHQPLHAKALAFVGSGFTRFAFGSANFTRPGLFRPASSGNLEVAIVTDLARFGVKDVARVFDPLGTSKPLRQVGDLRSGVDDPAPAFERPTIKLVEATLEGDQLRCRMEDVPIGATKPLIAHLEFADGYETRIRLDLLSEVYVGRVPSPAVRRCNDGTATITISFGASTSEAEQSNSLFLINLTDVETGVTGTLQRRVRAAQRGAAQFVGVLTDLLREGETDQLKTFLTRCDIRLKQPRATRLTQTRSPWTPPDGWRTIGARHLRDYESLHDAVVGFADRHLARMETYCAKPSSAALGNFLHIASAVVSTVESQAERALCGIESTPPTIQPDTWFKLRRNLERYARIAEHALSLVVDGYYLALDRKRGSHRDLSVESDAAALANQVRKLLRARPRIMNAVWKGIRVRTLDGHEVAPEFNPRDLLDGRRWAQWESKMVPLLDRLAAHG